MDDSDRTVLLTGATGYVGGRLLHALEEKCVRVRCMSRRPEKLRPGRAPTTELVAGDVLDTASLVQAMRGVHAAYYLIHSMGETGEFEEKDRDAATNFAEAAGANAVDRIIYLGGLADESRELSAHLRSRLEVGHLLASRGTRVLEFRASVVLGAGSFSFEMIRALVNRLPIMVTPRWVRTPSQPIAIDDVIDYLMAGLDLPFEGHRVYEIGGPDRVSYQELMREYARQRGLCRFMIPVPVLTPGLSSLWLALVTPLHAKVGRKLIDSLPYPMLVHDNSALETFPIRPMGVGEAIAKAIRESPAGRTRTAR